MGLTYDGGHEQIEAVRWRDPSDGTTGECTRERMAEWIGREGGLARVRDAQGREIAIYAVRSNTPHIRAFAVGVWTDDLLALPRY